MVQTEDQYVFIHDALMEACVCGVTEVPARNLHHHIQQLMQTPAAAAAAANGGVDGPVIPVGPLEPNVTGMELEFKRLTSIQQTAAALAASTEPDKFASANNPCNKFKNRLVNILPYESSRVCLQPIRGERKWLRTPIRI